MRGMHQDLLKRPVPLGWGGFQCGGDGAISKRGNVLWDGKITFEGAFQNLLKSFLSPGGGLEGSNEENWEDNRKKMFCSEIWENNVWEGLVKILWESPCVICCVLGAIFTGCIVVCLEKNEEEIFWGWSRWWISS